MYFLQIVLKDAHPVQLESCQCTCVAGTALCNHVAALLYQTAHYCQLRITSVPPTHSCTETEQKWHKPRTMVTNVTLTEYFDSIYGYLFIDNLFFFLMQGVKPGPVNDMVILSARPKERKLVEGIRLVLLLLSLKVH